MVFTEELELEREIELKAGGMLKAGGVFVGVGSRSVGESFLFYLVVWVSVFDDKLYSLLAGISTP